MGSPRLGIISFMPTFFFVMHLLSDIEGVLCQQLIFVCLMVMEEAALTVKTSDQDNCAIQLQELQQLRKQCDKGKLGELKNPKRSRCKSSPSPLAIFSHAFSYVFFTLGAGATNT